MPAAAKSFGFTTIDAPGATSTTATGINNRGEIVGTYTDSKGTHGFDDNNSSFTTINLAPTTRALGINDRGAIVGALVRGGPGSGISFIYDKGTVTLIDVPGSGGTTVASGINARGEIVGGYFGGGVRHGFLDNKGTFTTIDVPGAPLTAANGINASGEIVGSYFDNTFNSHGFVDEKGTFNFINVPGATSTTASGINDRGTVIGSYLDSKGTHGFVDDKGSFTTINVPGATSTTATGINNRGEIVGTYTDSKGTHGFEASATGKQAASAFVAMSDLLASQAGQISMSDLVPGSVAIGGQSAQASNSSGSLDNSTGRNFSGLAFAGITDTTIQVMPNGSG